MLVRLLCWFFLVWLVCLFCVFRLGMLCFGLMFVCWWFCGDWCWVGWVVGWLLFLCFLYFVGRCRWIVCLFWIEFIRYLMWMVFGCWFWLWLCWGWIVWCCVLFWCCWLFWCVCWLLLWFSCFVGLMIVWYLIGLCCW